MLNGLTETGSPRPVMLHQMISKALRRLGTDTGQAAQSLNQRIEAT